MEPKICPYLGLVDDQNSSNEHPSEDHACHRLLKPIPVKLSYQRSHCLNKSYINCPGYVTGWENGFPKSLRSNFRTRKQLLYNKNVWLVSGGIIILFLLVVFLPQLTNFGQNFRSRLDGWVNPPATATIAITPNKTFKASTLTETTAPSATPLPSNTPTNTHTPTLLRCIQTYFLLGLIPSRALNHHI